MGENKLKNNQDENNYYGIVHASGEKKEAFIHQWYNAISQQVKDLAPGPDGKIE